MQDHRGFSLFGGAEQGRTPGFHLGDDNVPPSVMREREEAARKKQDEEDDLAARQHMEARLLKHEERERQRTAGHAGERPGQPEDWDDENYAVPKVPVCATGSLPIPAAAPPPDRAELQRVPDNHAASGDRTGNGGQQPPPLPVAHTMPLWQKVSGLSPHQEAKMNGSERRYAIRKLRKEYELRIRASLDEYEREQRETAENCGAADPSPQPPPARGGGAGAAPAAEESDRTFLWSPLDAICHELGIARRKLSAYMRELSGMSAQEVIDKIKAENIAAKLKEKLAECANYDYEFYFSREEAAYRKRVRTPEHPTWMLMSNKVTPEQLEREKQESRMRIEIGMNCEPKCGWAPAAGALMKRVWESRRAQPSIAWAENSRYAARQQFARELGFSSYNRLYRACLLSCGKTVMELEHAAALELFLELDKEAAPRRDKVKEEVLKT